MPVLAALAVLWIVWLTNLYNFMDGIDGLAGAQALIAALGLAAVAGGARRRDDRLAAPRAGRLERSDSSSSTFRPSSIFMGDVGSTAIGFFFGVLPLLPESRPVPVEPVALALSLFVLDATATLLRRVASGREVVHPPPHPPVPAPGRAGGGAPARPARGGGRHGGRRRGVRPRWADVGAAGRLALLAVPVALFGLGRSRRRLERRG